VVGVVDLGADGVIGLESWPEDRFWSLRRPVSGPGVPVGFDPRGDPELVDWSLWLVDESRSVGESSTVSFSVLVSGSSLFSFSGICSLRPPDLSPSVIASLSGRAGTPGIVRR
jgi:hypothetical protein